MEAAERIDRTTDDAGRASGGASARLPDRRCLVTRETFPVDRLVRFVAGPDGAVVPDVERRLPGRGLWLQASRDIVEKACETRAFAKAARAPVTAEPGLADRVERLLARRCLDLLGLARRSGAAVAGHEKAAALVRRGKVALFLIAADASPGERNRVTKAAPDAPVVALFSGAELGVVFGRERAVHVAVAPDGLAARLLVECGRLSGFRRADRTKNEG